MLRPTTLGLLAIGVLVAPLSAQDKEGVDGFAINFKAGGKYVAITIKKDTLKAYVDGRIVTSVNLHKPARATNILAANGQPVATIQSLATGKVLNKPVARAELGINVAEVGPALAKHLELDPKQCVIVLSADKGKAADKAGLEKHDIVVGIDGNARVSRKSLTKLIATKKPGDRITLRVLRGGEPTKVVVKLGKARSSRVHYRGAVADVLAAQAGKALVPSSPKLNLHPTLLYGIGADQVVSSLGYPTQSLPWSMTTGVATGKATARSKALEKELALLRTELGRLRKLMDKLLQQK